MTMKQWTCKNCGTLNHIRRWKCRTCEGGAAMKPDALFLAAKWLGEHGFSRDGIFVASLTALLSSVRAEEREHCARIAEEHTEHMDFSDPQEHHEPPMICNIAAAIRGGKSE